MKKINLTLLLIFLIIQLNAQESLTSQSVEAGYYLNPIFAGDYPDPSILVDGKDYYVVNSSFEYYPGLTIWHSTDLVNWVPVTNALQTDVGSVWAPDLVKYDNKYYIYFPANNSNYVITANSIEGPWSEPVELKVGNIDPGHIADADGNRYLYFSDGGYVPLSRDGLAVTGEMVHAYDGWPIPREWTIECFCMEGPKVAKRGDYYYLTVAEGGTAGPATGHMVISARSKSPLGPWENSPYNPIVRAQSDKDKWWSVGHGTVFEDAYGDWWMIFHGYENGHQNLGRQTLLVPLEWTEDAWFKIPDNIKLDKPIKKPKGDSVKETFNLSDDFRGAILKPYWHFYGEYDANRYHLAGGNLTLIAKGNSVSDCSPLLCMPGDHSYTASVEMEIEGDAIGGLLLFYNNNAYSGILADSINILANLRGWQFVAENNVINRHVFLRIKNTNNTVDMYYSLDGKNWIKLRSSLEVSAYHHNVLGGFMSLRIGLCAIGEGTVKFKNFSYE